MTEPEVEHRGGEVRSQNQPEQEVKQSCHAVSLQGLRADVKCFQDLEEGEGVSGHTETEEGDGDNARSVCGDVSHTQYKDRCVPECQRMEKVIVSGSRNAGRRSA